MSFDGNGNFLRIMNWSDDAAAGIKIKSDRHDQQDNDFATGLSNTITKDGQSQPTADIPMNGKKLTNLGDPTAEGDAANKKYVDALKTFTTNLDLSGADANGRLNFTSATGANGLTFTGADLAWLAKLADTTVTPNLKNRLVLNDKVDGTGTDIVILNDDGTAVFGPNATVKGTSAMFRIVPTTGNGHVYWFAANGTDVRAVIYTSGGAQGNLIAQLGNGKNFQFATDGSFYINSGAMALQYNGNISGSGSIWANWGANDAFNAISARIEARAQAWAVAQMNNTVTSMRSAGYVEYAPPPTGAPDVTYSGYYVTRVWRRNGDEYRFGFRMIQMYIPSQGWLQATAW